MQIRYINMTSPLIGNYGTNSYENESDKIHANGFIVKSICLNPSNYKSEVDIDKMLKKMGVIGIYGIDTRSITKKIRNSGAMKCIIASEEHTITELEQYTQKL